MKKTYQQQIRKLEDQLFVLQNSLNDFISYNSINKQYKNLPLRRHVPVQIYLATDNIDKIKLTYHYIEQLLNQLDFELYEPLDYFCHFVETICISKIPLTLSDVEDKLLTLHRLVQSKDVMDVSILPAWNILLEAVQQIPQVTLKLGSIIILQYHNSERIPVVQSYHLTISQLIQIEQNPRLLRKPELLISTLGEFQ